jgi:pSer/pThr/pTyr-binding forkhead associated (FHA) protein
MHNNDIFLEDIKVSRQHAFISVDDDGNCMLKDVGSSNGTIVNGKILRKGKIHILKGGDVIQMGQTILVFNSGHDF